MFYLFNQCLGVPLVYVRIVIVRGTDFSSASWKNDNDGDDDNINYKLDEKYKIKFRSCK